MRRRSLTGPVAAFAILLASLAGCGFGPASTPFTVSYPASTAGANPIPISLIDQTGMVAAIAAVPDASAGTGVELAPDIANGLRVSWQGGPCDDRVTLVLNTLGGDRYELAIHNHPPITAGLNCDASTVARTVDITFSQHLEPGELTLNVTYP